MAPITKPKPVLGKTYLLEWREFRGLNQSQAAEGANISRTLLSKIENGHSPYLQQHIESLAEVYKCSPSDLIGKDPRLPATPIRGDEAIREMLDRIEGLKPEEKHVFLGMILSSIKLNTFEQTHTHNDDQSEKSSLRHEPTT